MASSGSATGTEIGSRVVAKVSFESIVGVDINEAIDPPELIQREVDVEMGGEAVGGEVGREAGGEIEREV